MLPIVLALLAVLPALSPGASPGLHQTAVVSPVGGGVVRPFDPPDHPYGPGHRGVDLAVGPGTAVVAALDGRIAFSGVVAGVGWVTLDHGGGLVTTYGDLVDRLASGRSVHAGQVVGRTAPGVTHLDWGARLDGAYLDPLRLLQRWTPHLAHDDP